MAWHFDESNDHVTIGDAPSLTLPDGDWTIGGWVRLTDNSGTAWQYFLSWGGFGASPNVNIYFVESGGNPANQIRVSTIDSDGDLVAALETSGSPGTSTDWQHIILQRFGTTFLLYIDGVADGSSSNADVNAINVSDDLFLGTRSDLTATRFFGGAMGDWFKIDRAISAGERAALANGMSASRINGIFNNTSWYVPMNTPNYVEHANQLTVTNNGSTQADHAPIALARRAPTFFMTIVGGVIIPTFNYPFNPGLNRGFN